MKDVTVFSWLGRDETFLDQPTVFTLNDVAIGRYGGCTNSGAYKNEDGALVWSNPEQGWIFSVLLDAHMGSDSADAVLTLVEDIKGDLLKAFDLPIERTFASLQASIVQAFKSEDFLSKCQYLRGETACLICAQKGKYLWWFSVGDCVVYLLNSELVQLGQYALNQRQFFEWIGRVNTFSSPVPSFTVGVRELRGGPNHVLMTTDGLLEFENRPFEDPKILAKVVSQAPSCKTAVQKLLERVVEGKGRDSATIISWRCNNTEPVTYPSG